MIKLAYIVSHPIQYQAPLLRLIAERQNIDLTVFFLSNISVRDYKDQGFGEKIKWDIPLLDGYRYKFLPSIGSKDRLSFCQPHSYGLTGCLKAGKFDVLWVHGYGHYSCVQAIGVAKRLGIKVLLRGESNLISAPRGALKRLVKDTFIRKLFAMCDGFLSIGSLNRKYYRYYGVSEERLFSMPYAVDNAFFQQRVARVRATRGSFRSSLGLQSGRPVILYASKLMARKHPMDLLEAYIQLSPDGSQEPEPYLLYVGNGEERERLEVRAKGTGWSSIHFLGFQNQTKLPAFFDLCDVFVLPSVFEPWGLIVNEVMNAGKPVIVSDQVGCAPDLVKDGVNGYIVPPRDISALSKALHVVIESPERAKRMGEMSLKQINQWGFEEDLKGIECAIEAVITK